jgi:hypothetical protein
MQELIAALLRVPSGASYLALHQAVVATPAYRFYDDTLRRLEPLAGSDTPAVFLLQLPSCMPGFLLTPRLHQLAARCAAATGDQARARYERVFARQCLAGLQLAGTGDILAPYPITHVEDAYDLLQQRGWRALAWQRQVVATGILDVALLDDGRRVFFDISASSVPRFGDGA